MFTTKFCPRCIQLASQFRLSILPHRLASTSADNAPTSIDDEPDTTMNIDQNVSRLPADVYQHYKGK